MFNFRLRESMREYINRNAGRTRRQDEESHVYERYVIGLSNFPNVTGCRNGDRSSDTSVIRISFTSLPSPLSNAHDADGTTERGVLCRHAIIHGVGLRIGTSPVDRRRNYCVLQQRELGKAMLTREHVCDKSRGLFIPVTRVRSHR